MTEEADSKRDITSHILPTAANLLGICFLVFSFISILKLGDQTLLDEIIAIAIALFLFSSLASYASLRRETAHRLYQKAADCFFIVGLILLTLSSLVIVLKIIV